MAPDRESAHDGDIGDHPRSGPAGRRRAGNPERGSTKMIVHNFAFPITPGKEDLARQFAKEALGEHGDHYTSLMKASGTTRVTWTLDETPVGTFILVWFEADDLRIFEILATGTDPAASWMRGRIEEIGGIELTGPLPGPAPELVLEWPA